MAAPYLPQNVVLQTGNGQNFLLWDLVVGATSYSVQRSLDGVKWWPPISVPGNSYLDATVSVGTSYFYQVASSNGELSPYSACYPVSIVPCLPGQINLGYLRYQAQLRSDKLNSQYLTLDEWNININNSRAELYDIMTMCYGDDYFFAPPLLIPLTGMDYYPLPDGSNYPQTEGPYAGQNAPACFKLNGVDANIAGSSVGANAGWIPLARNNWSDRDRFYLFPEDPQPVLSMGFIKCLIVRWVRIFTSIHPTRVFKSGCGMCRF